jgi:hypothetical protein
MELKIRNTIVSVSTQQQAERFKKHGIPHDAGGFWWDTYDDENGKPIPGFTVISGGPPSFGVYAEGHRFIGPAFTADDILNLFREKKLLVRFESDVNEFYRCRVGIGDLVYEATGETSAEALSGLYLYLLDNKTL